MLKSGTDTPLVLAFCDMYAVPSTGSIHSVNAEDCSQVRCVGLDNKRGSFISSIQQQQQQQQEEAGSLSKLQA